MDSKMVFALVVTLALLINAASSSAIYRSLPGEEFVDTESTSDDDFEEPIYQPRFLPFFTDNAAIGKVAEIVQNPGNKTLQENLLDLVADVALKNFGGDDTLKRVIEMVKNSQNKTFQEIIMNVAAEVAIGKFGNDETIKKIAEVLKNPGNRTIQENLINLASEVADSKLKGNGTLKKVAEVLQKPGNRTLQENLLNVVFEIGLSKYEDNEIIKSVSEVFKNSKNKTMQENLLNLATRVALTKFGNNPIIKMVATSLQDSGNVTLNEKLSAMADAALTASLGPIQAAIIKQGIGIAGQALKAGGSLLGDALADIGGDSPLGKVGKAISNGTQAVGGLMSSFGGGDKGVGAAIEKFADSLKGKNVTVQEALKQAGASTNGNFSKTEKETSVDETVKAVDNVVEHNQSGIKTGLVNIQQSSSESNHADAETISTENSLIKTEELVKNEQSSVTEPAVEGVKVEEINSLDNVKKSTTGRIPEGDAIEIFNETDQNNSQQTQVGVVDGSKASKSAVDQSIKEEAKPLSQVYQKQVSTVSEKPVSLGRQSVTNDRKNVQIRQTGTAPGTDSSGGSLNSQYEQGLMISEESQYGSKQGLTKSQESTALRRQSTPKNDGKNYVSSQSYTVSPADSSEGIMYSQYGSKQGSTNSQEPTSIGRQSTSNYYRESDQSSRSNTVSPADSSKEDMYSQYGSKQGLGSYSSSYLGSASEAIRAAREALQAGGDALGGALSSLGEGTSSESQETTERQGRRSGSPLMNIEITRVKLKMM